MKLDRVVYKRMEDKYLPALQILFAKIFRRRVTIQYLKAKYDTSYLGIKYTCFMAFQDEKPIAFYGAIPQRFLKNGETILVAHACDSLTVKQHRKKGLHYNLAVKTYDLMKAEGFKFVYAFHSDNTFHSTKKLNWKVYKRMSRFHLPVGSIPLAKVFPRLGLQRVYESLLSKIFQPYIVDVLSTTQESNGQKYSREFFNYKNAFSSHFEIQMNGCTFWLKVESIMKIGIFTAPSLFQFKSAIRSLSSLARKIGVTEILFQVSPGTSQYQLLEKILEPQESWLIGYLSFDLYANESGIDFHFNYCDLDTF